MHTSSAAVNDSSVWALVKLQRGPSVLAVVQAVLGGVAGTVEALAEWLGRAEREIRRLLNSAMNSGVLSPDVVAILRPILGDKRRKAARLKAEVRKIADCSRAGVSVSEKKEQIQIETQAHEGTDNIIELQPCPPPVRGSIVRSTLQKAGYSPQFTWAELERLERRLRHYSPQTVRALAERYAADTAAIDAARSLVAMFLHNLPRYIAEHQRGEPTGRNIARAERVVSTPAQPIPMTPAKAPAAKQHEPAGVTADYAARWNAACVALAADADADGLANVASAVRALAPTSPQPDAKHEDLDWCSRVAAVWRAQTGSPMPFSAAWPFSTLSEFGAAYWPDTAARKVS